MNGTEIKNPFYVPEVRTSLKGTMGKALRAKEDEHSGRLWYCRREVHQLHLGP